MNESQLEILAARLRIERPSERLIDYRLIALPVWSLGLECEIEKDTPVRAIELQLLEGVRMGLGKDEISMLLSVNTTTLEVFLKRMLNKNWISHDYDVKRLVLTDLGESTLKEESTAVTTTEIVPQIYSPILETFVSVKDSINRNEIASEVDRINHTPKRDVKIGDLDTVAAIDFLNNTDVIKNSKNSIRDIANVAKCYARWQMAGVFFLEKSSRNNTSVIMEIGLENRLSDEYRKVISNIKLRAKYFDSHISPPTVFIDKPLTVTQRRNLGVPEGFTELDKSSEVGRRASQIPSMESSDEPSSGTLSNDDSIPENEPIVEVTPQEVARNFMVLRTPADHKNTVKKALRESKSRVYITSGFVSKHAVNPLIDDLKKAASRGVEIKIMAGLESPNERDRKRPRREAHINLTALAKKNRNIDYLYHGNLHSKSVLVDSFYFVKGSFNYLSYRPADTTSRVEEALLIYDENQTNAEAESFLEEFSKTKKKQS